MPVTADKPAPYAPASAILDIIERHRSRGLPSPVNADVLGRAGVSSSLIPRTLQSLHTLDLIDENGAPSDIFERIRKAPEVNFRDELADWLKASYADALAFVDPATADETQVRDAFRSYKPIGMQDRMVTLFMSLFAAAGVAPERQRSSPRRQPPSTLSNGRRPARPANVATEEKPAVAAPAATTSVPQTSGPSLPPAIAGLLTGLPAVESGWTKAERDRFVLAFQAVLDVCIPVRGTSTGDADQ